MTLSFCQPFPVIVFWTHYMCQTSKGQERMQHPCQTPTQLFSYYLNQLWCSLTWHARCFGFCAVHMETFTCSLLLFFAMNPLRGKIRMTVAIPARADGPRCCTESKPCEGRLSSFACEWQLNYISTYLPEKEEAEANLNRSQPDCVEIHHKVHELLSVCWDQIHNLAHSASPPGSAVYHQRLQWQKKKAFQPVAGSMWLV